MDHSIIEEGKAKIMVDERSTHGNKSISKKLEVFYNPVMEFTRTITIALLNAVPNKGMQMADPLAGSGVRAIRMLKELGKGKVKSIGINDLSRDSLDHIKRNISLNGLKQGKSLAIHNKDANIFLLESSGFDYIDIDPFGSPIPFMDSACARIARDGIIAVTATDTAALAGTSIEACRRKYSAKSMRNELMHETGIRILIKKCQEIGALHEKALIPILSYSKDHYYRVFFRCEKGRQKADELLKQHKFLLYNSKTMDYIVSENNSAQGFNEFAGPLYAGRLWDSALLKKMKTESMKDEEKRLIDTLRKEESYPAFFFDLHSVCRRYGLRIPTNEFILKRLGAVITHFDIYGIKTMQPLSKAIEQIRAYGKKSG